MSAGLLGLLLRSCDKVFLYDIKPEQKPEEQLLQGHLPMVPSFLLLNLHLVSACVRVKTNTVAAKSSGDHPSTGRRSRENSCLVLEDKDANLY